MSTAVERRIVELHLKMTGSELGLYNVKTKKFSEDLTSQGVYQANLEIVREALKGGWVAADLENTIRERYTAGERAALLSELLPKKEVGIKEGDNLLDPAMRYQHPQLYTRTAPTYSVDGEVLVSIAPGRLTRKENFTLKELAQYYFQAMHQGANPRSWGATLGSLRFHLRDNRVDEVLWAIDLAAETGEEVRPIDLSRFLPDARNEVRNRMSRSG